MTCSEGVVLAFIMLMMIGMVKGRWLEVEPIFTTSSMVSDGIDNDMSHDNPSGYLGIGSLMLDSETRCQSIYGFMPCADTMAEGVFLMITYTHLMMLGENWIRKGTEALFFLIGDKKIGASVFQVLMTLPRIAVVVVAGFVSTESAAQNQVAFGASMYAGSTLITLTLIWGFRIILSRHKLRRKGSTSEHQQEHSSSGCWSSIEHKLSYLSDTGVIIEKETANAAIIMLLSLIPFAVVELVALFNSPIMILLALVVSGVSLLSYFGYQISTPLIRSRILLYLKQEELQKRLFFHVKKLLKDDLIDGDGNLKFDTLKSLFDSVDSNHDDSITQLELERLIKDVFKLEKENISLEYAKTEIMTRFDRNKSEEISWSEFTEGCRSWLEKWKKVPKTPNSDSDNLWKKLKKLSIKREQAKLTQMEIVMPKVLKQLVLEEHQLVSPDRKADRAQIEGLFDCYDEDHDGIIHRDEIKKFIKTLRFGVSLDSDTLLDELIADLGNKIDGTIPKHEFVEGMVRWIDKAIDHDHSINDPVRAILKYEEDSWAEIDKSTYTVKPKAGIVYVIFGIGVMYLISGAFMQSVLQFSTAAHIPFHLTSFVVCPIAMNARMVIRAVLNTGPSVAKNASLTFFEIYGGLVMNNLLGLLTLLITVHMKRLSWTYSNEVWIIIIPCAIVGIYALKRDTYPLWASISAMLLYPISIGLYCVMYS